MKSGHGDQYNYFFCNVCGKPTYDLVKSHALNSHRQRTGRILMTCPECHTDYHVRRGDFIYWGKKSIAIQKKKASLNMAYVSHGFKYKKFRSTK